MSLKVALKEVVLSCFNEHTGTLTSEQRNFSGEARGLAFRQSLKAWLATLALSVTTLLLSITVSTAADTIPPARIQDLRVGTAASLPAWVASSLERIGPSDAAGALTQMELYAARGEAESFQVSVRAPAGGLTNVRVTASDLTGPGASVIAARNLSLFREHYVYVSSGSTSAWGPPNLPSGAPGWFPDGLIPSVDPDTKAPLSGAQLTAFPFTLAAGQDQPVWIDINVPRGIAAGRYTGTVSITANEGTGQVSVAMNVWGFDLPVKPSLNSAFPTTTQATLATSRELLRNRLMPAGVTTSQERMLIDSCGLNVGSIGLFSGAYNGSCVMSTAPPVSSFQQLAATHQADLLLYDWSADEIESCATQLAPTVKAWAQNMHKAGIKNLIPMVPVPELYDDGSGTGASAVDIWVIAPVLYDGAAARINYVLAKGDMAWSYNGMVQDAYSPKWEIDFAPVNYRVQPGFINQSLGFTGLLYWRIDLWSADPWNNVDSYPPTPNHYPGEGMLVYPGTQVGIPGVAPSMRLKWLRDGADDYDYIQILKGLGRGAFALQVARTVGQDWHTWTHDPVALENARRQLGQEIHNILNP